MMMRDEWEKAYAQRYAEPGRSDAELGCGQPEESTVTENELAVSALRRIANIAHHGALLGYDEDSAVREIRRLSMPWWNKAEADELQRRDAAAPRPKAIRERDVLKLRAGKAESERDAALAANRDCVDHFEQLRAELEALKKRIAEAPTTKVIQWYQESKDKNRRVIHYGMDHCYVGQRVRLLVEDDA